MSFNIQIQWRNLFGIISIIYLGFVFLWTSHIFFHRLNAFLEGFYDIIPKRLISIFNEQELELLISGLPNVDIEDLKANTEYHKYTATSLQVRILISFVYICSILY